MVTKGNEMTELKEIADLLREIRDAVRPKIESQPEPSQPEPPSWADIPAEYLWLAQDGDGVWFVYVNEPTQGERRWWPNSGKAAGINGNCAPNPNWRETKQRRPELLEPDWSKAPEWAEWWFAGFYGRQVWCEVKPTFLGRREWDHVSGKYVLGDDCEPCVGGPHTLRQRPKPEAKPEPDWSPPPWSECPEDAEWMVLGLTGSWLASESSNMPELRKTGAGTEFWSYPRSDAFRVVKEAGSEFRRPPPRHIWQSSRMRRPEGV